MCLTDLLTNENDIDETNQSQFTPSAYFDTEEFALLAKHHTNGFVSIFNSNARSLLRHKVNYDTFFEYIFEKSKFSFDILCFEETWLSSELENLACFNSYENIYRHKQPNKEGGGIAIFIKNYLKYNIRCDIIIPDNLIGLFDCIFIDLDIENVK